jgi:GTP-binding protein
MGKDLPRVAMVGRSNVGKSSLLNALTQAKLAQTSATPGKTQKIHFYNWPEVPCVLVDLPGYGFAVKSHEEREIWRKLIEGYFQRDKNLQCLLVLLDSRHGPTPIDEEALAYFETLGLRLIWVMTKADQIRTQSDRVKRVREVKSLAPGDIFWVSVEKGAMSELGKLRNHLKNLASKS